MHPPGTHDNDVRSMLRVRVLAVSCSVIKTNLIPKMVTKHGSKHWWAQSVDLLVVEYTRVERRENASRGLTWEFVMHSFFVTNSISDSRGSVAVIFNVLKNSHECRRLGSRNLNLKSHSRPRPEGVPVLQVPATAGQLVSRVAGVGPGPATPEW